MIDKYYCINLVESRERHNYCAQQFNNIGIDVNFWYTTRRPIMQMFGSQIPGIKTDAYTNIQNNFNPYTFGAVFSCVFEHYSIIKQAYERGLNNIIIFEDDIEFLINKDEWNYCIENIPKSYHLCRFQYTGESLLNFTKNISPFIPETTKRLSAMAYAISKEGMREYINAFEHNKILCADMMFFYLTNKYVNNITICKPHGFRSSINCKM